MIIEPGLTYVYFYRSADGRLLAGTHPMTGDGLVELTEPEYDREVKIMANAIAKRRAALVDQHNAKRAAVAKKLGLEVTDLAAMK